MTGIIIVDHGSRRAESNQMLEELAALFGERFRARYSIVEPAHMELCEPSIATAYARCVERGANEIIVCPFFLGPGKHWTGDIPRLAAEASSKHPGTRYHVTMPLGIDDLMLELLAKRIGFCTQHNLTCDSCRGTIRSGEKGATVTETATSHSPPPPAAVQCTSCPFVVQSDGTIIDRRTAPAHA